MTTSISVISIAIAMTIVSCGPSAEEKAWRDAQQKHITDSIAAATHVIKEVSFDENGNETLTKTDGSTTTTNGTHSVFDAQGNETVIAADGSTITSTKK